MSFAIILRRCFLGACLICVLLSRCAAAAERLVDYVNPIIGTGGEGFGVGSTYPGPAMPFGMIHAGPDTTMGDSAPGFYHCSGYYYKDKHIRGFSHTRMNGVGVPEYGNIQIMPTIGAAADMVDEKKYRANFSHKQEEARAGYYSVLLKNTGIKAELASGYYTAHHRYTFPESSQSLIVLNASHSIDNSGPTETDVRVNQEASEITGWFLARGGRLKTYFVIDVKTPFKTFGTWKDGKYAANEPAARGTSAGAVLEFKTTRGEVVDLKIAISFISVEQARANMRSDEQGWDFGALRARAESAWEKLLSRIKVEGGSATQRRKFYSALYHVMLMPTLFTEAGGKYVGIDKKVHVAKGFRYYSDFSMWDTFRTEHPLLVLIAPEYQRDMVVSLTKMYEQGGWMPKWPSGTDYTDCMSGTPADIVIADTYLKGIRNFDAKLAYKGLRDTAMRAPPPGSPTGGRGGIENYIKMGYVPVEDGSRSAAETLEYAYEDYALSRFAAALGKKEDAAMFAARSKNYRNIWNPEVKFFDGRKKDGTFVKPFNATSWRDAYEEGNAWQWLWLVPHDVEGLMELLGGRDGFFEKLDTFFKKSHTSPHTIAPDQYYWPANEPDIHAPYLFLWAGRPDRAQEELRWCMERRYLDGPDGLPGNDDGGTMSAWYAFSAMGFYPFAGTDIYAIGSPVFSKVTMLVNGKKFVITAPGTSAANLYVQNVTLNGRAKKDLFLKHSDLWNGGSMRIDMGAAPGKIGMEEK